MQTFLQTKEGTDGGVKEEPHCLQTETILGGFHDPSTKRMWEAALHGAELCNLHTEAGMGGGARRRVETKGVRVNQPVTGIKLRIHLFSGLLRAIIIRKKLLFTRPFVPPKYLKCCFNSKYHLWPICPGRREGDLEYLIEMCCRR